VCKTLDAPAESVAQLLIASPLELEFG
jgi:hypothetical protein